MTKIQKNVNVPSYGEPLLDYRRLIIYVCLTFLLK